MSTDTPIVLITPDAKAALETEVKRGGSTGELTGGLLFGYPLDERHRLVISSVRPSGEVGFGQQNFALNQTRTSRQLKHARSLAPEATYCGVWYIHRTPIQELTDEEWMQAQSLLEDPDFRFKDLVCLVLCFYSGELNIYASSFDRYQSARGQPPTPTQLQLMTGPLPTQAADVTLPSAPPPTPTNWLDSPGVAARLRMEHERLAQTYRAEPAMMPDGQMVFRLTPKDKHQKLAFYLACGSGFPKKAPWAFLLAGGKRHPLSSPGLVNWSEKQWLVEMADELMKWLNWSLDQFVPAAEEALNRGDYQEAADLLTVVLATDPRTPRAARLLARAQAPLR
ncbi:MAG: hypothetical protein E3J21_12775 [Anaerolineales bacterium]|nr:MAG: hypothetical protein E3J21_12775 [Anaerolineales bacterium]